MKLNLIIAVLYVSYAASAVSGANKGLGMIGTGNKCTIINRSWNEPLYPGNDLSNYDGERRRIFTYIPGGCGDQCNWKIETIHTDSGYKFKLKSLYFDEYFFAAASNFRRDDYRRNVFSWIPTTTECCNGFDWEIEALGDGSGYVTIKNIEYNEYLYAAVKDFNYDGHRRGVFAWKYTSDDVPVAYDWACHWEINCLN